MNITLTSVEYVPALTRESSCFVARIVVDGLRVGIARNFGHGGQTLITPRALDERLGAYARRLPHRCVTDGRITRTLPQTADTLIEDALARALAHRASPPLTTTQDLTS